MIKLATVFSGIGSVEQALKRLGIEYKIVFACDNGDVDIQYEPAKELKNIRSLKSKKAKKEYVDNLYAKNSKKQNYVKKSYLANYDIKVDDFHLDVRLLDGKDYKDNVDIFVGGSPCQSFSTVGDMGGLEDIRGTLFYEYARLVSEIRPKVFIYENVRGLYTHDKGKTWEVIKKTFDKLGYKYKFDILDAKDYGIPQTRRRLFVVGFRGDIELVKDFEFPKKIRKKKNFKMQNLLLEYAREGNVISRKGELVVKEDGDRVEDKYFLSEKLEKYVMSSGTKTFYQKPEIDLEIARPLLSTMGNRHRAGIDNYVTVDGKIRMLTEREAHRLMGFPDTYKIVVSRAQAYKQAGNSIVVDVMLNVVKGIVETGIFDN